LGEESSESSSKKSSKKSSKLEFGGGLKPTLIDSDPEIDQSEVQSKNQQSVVENDHFPDNLPAQKNMPVNKRILDLMSKERGSKELDLSHLLTSELDTTNKDELNDTLKFEDLKQLDSPQTKALKQLYESKAVVMLAELPDV
jgi:hypothetical protein